MRGIRSALLGALAVALTVTSWGALGGTAVAKAAKVSCNPKTAVKEIEPLLDIEASVTNPMKNRLATLQFGNLQEVAKQVVAVDKSNPLKTARAKPIADITFPDKRSAIGNLTITLNPEGTQTINQGPQFFMCVGKDQGGTKKGAWRLTLYSYCNLAALAPCPSSLVTKALNSLTPALQAETTK